MQQALIIFIRNPEKGKVKTRIAKTLGDEKALLVYMKLLEHTRQITTQLACRKYLFYVDEPNQQDEWSNELFIKRKQVTGNLGEKMAAAFKTVFEEGSENILIIGSDCYDLSTSMIENAFMELSNADVVIGPAVDGGYYLLGLQKPVNALFENISWSTATVLEQTIAVCQQQGLAYRLLPELNDVDEAADIHFDY